MTDPELQALKRRLEAEPGDEALAEQYTRALLRAGQDAELRRHLATGFTCSRRWEHHERDPRSAWVRWCDGCEAGVRRVHDPEELARYVAEGQRVAGPPALLEPYLDRMISSLRAGDPPAAPACFAPTTRTPQGPPDHAPRCECLQEGAPPPRFHREVQDTSCDAWRLLLRVIDQCAEEGAIDFYPRQYFSADQWMQIVTLPAGISRLTEVSNLELYGSHLVRLPPEIGALQSLSRFSPYTSYRLHWFPYEITRVRRPFNSTVSTRALYGNVNHRPPFPDLRVQRGPESGRCSVCDAPVARALQRWITLRVGTDELPLLVNACSEACLARLPTPPENHHPGPHLGGSVRPDGSINSRP